jgi:hypothetical protein
LANLDVSHNNKLTALPTLALTQSSDLQLWTRGTPLVDPPLRVIELGTAAVKRYFDLRARAQRGAWVIKGSRLSRHFHLRSALAAVESLVMTGAMVEFGG